MSVSETDAERLPIALRTEALESILVERGLVDPKVMDGFIKNYEENVGPMNGAKVVAKAWVDPEYKARLLAEGTVGHRRAGLQGPPGRAHRGRRADAGHPPRGRVHPVLLLPVAGAGTAAGLVQGPRLPVAHGP